MNWGLKSLVKMVDYKYNGIRIPHIGRQLVNASFSGPEGQVIETELLAKLLGGKSPEELRELGKRLERDYRRDKT